MKRKDIKIDKKRNSMFSTLEKSLSNVKPAAEEEEAYTMLTVTLDPTS